MNDAVGVAGGRSLAKRGVAVLIATVFLSSASPALATTRYVDVNSAAPAAPYTTWATAAKAIQEAVDVAVAGDEVVVTNGAYATGGRVVYGTMTNRVVVDRAILLRSVNGPDFTLIQGYQVPGTTNGDGAVRCVYLHQNAVLSGFTLTNGATRSSGDAIHELRGGGIWCESPHAVVTNCVITGNSAYYYGGGAYNGAPQDCTFIGNNANWGGGYQGDLYARWPALVNTVTRCTFRENRVGDKGGGAAWAILRNCVLAGNSAPEGGGGGGAAWISILDGCLVVSNSAFAYGGGADGCSLNNCLIAANVAHYGGGGVRGGILNNCTVIGNGATSDYPGDAHGGGISWSKATNCIVYFNFSLDNPNYDTGSVLYSCCTTPLPANGAGNIVSDPLFLDMAGMNLRLQSNSPCINSGDNSVVSGDFDLDGLSRVVGGTVDMGAYEFHGFAEPVKPHILVQPATQEIFVGDPVEFSVTAGGTLPLSYQWSFNDEILPQETNALLRLAKVKVEDGGNYSVSVSNVAGRVTSEPAALSVRVPAVHFVDAQSVNPQPPFASWATAAINIQDAIDAASPRDEILVTNGVYASGGRAVHGTMTNRITIDKRLVVRSVNGPQHTIIQGYQVPGTTNGDGAIRCVYMTNLASLSGFTLTGGATRALTEYAETRQQSSGGGLWCESNDAVVSNCVLMGNSAYFEGGGAFLGTLNDCSLNYNTAGAGGGATDSTLNRCIISHNAAGNGGGAYYDYPTHCVLTDCLVISNTAAYDGGGAYGCYLTNCTVVGNSAAEAGGGLFGFIVIHVYSLSYACNSIVYSNTAPDYADYADGACMFDYSCTTPLPLLGTGNITNTPLFVNAPVGDLRLQPGSPCINAGNNTHAPPGPDLDGNARIVGGTVDMGAYEYQSPSSAISYAWLLRYGLPLDGSADFVDSDHDGLNNWQEWRAGTNPTNALSVLRLLTPTLTGTNLAVSWESVLGISYFLERAESMWPAPSGQGSTFAPIVTNVSGQAGTTTFVDTNVISFPGLFYRVGVRGE